MTGTVLRAMERVARVGVWLGGGALIALSFVVTIEVVLRKVFLIGLSAATELSAYALERAGWWRSFASFGATPAQSRVAHVVHRAYFLIWQQLREQAG